MSFSIGPASFRRYRIAASLTITAVGPYMAFQPVVQPIRREPRTATIGVSGPSVQAVGYEGTKVPIWVAMYLLGRCECVGLPGSGPLSPFRVEGA